MAPRFEKGGSDSTGGKLRNRHDPAGPPGRSDSPGDFLARLWSLFGAPDEVTDDGFAYRLRDRQSGLSFTGYSGASGPAYAGARRAAPALAPVLDDFDRLLDATPLADCALELGSGARRVRIGAVDGVPFERMARVRPDRSLSAARRVLASRSAAVWDYLNALFALDAVWRRAEDEADAAEVRRVAGELWWRALDRIEGFVARAPGTAVPTPGEIETLAEVALVQLEERAEVAGVELQAVRARLDAAAAGLRAMG